MQQSGVRLTDAEHNRGHAERLAENERLLRLKVYICISLCTQDLLKTKAFSASRYTFFFPVYTGPAENERLLRLKVCVCAHTHSMYV